MTKWWRRLWDQFEADVAEAVARLAVPLPERREPGYERKMAHPIPIKLSDHEIRATLLALQTMLEADPPPPALASRPDLRAAAVRAKSSLQKCLPDNTET